ncbi:MAG: SDR family NAD(P)-dependent oxidoreductase, partial [Pseudomonadota bacterium]
LALVTGASDGIGLASAEALARAGFDLVINARRKSALAQLATRLRAETGVDVHEVPADLSTEAGLDHLRAEIAGRDVGVAVLAAGFGSAAPLAEADPAVERGMLAVNCGAVLALCRDLGARMLARGAGQLVLFGSIVGFQGNGSGAHYAATKAWAQTLAEGLAMELAPGGVHVLAVAPGPVRSGFATRAGMQMGATDRPEAVAAGILRALGTSGTIRPGRMSKLLGWSLALTPRPLRVRLMTRIMGGMAAKRPSRETVHAA